MHKFYTSLLALVLLITPCTGNGQAAKQGSSSRKSSSVLTEDELRVRLQFHPHDREAHNKLIALLDKSGAHRARVIENASWIKNNPNDCFKDLNELRVYSDIYLHDPEFAIRTLRSYLSSASRDDDTWNYDLWVAQLAALLEKRNRSEEGVSLLSELIRRNPEEAGFWLDYGGYLSTAGHYKEAIKAINRSIELDPSMELAHKMLAEVQLKAGDLSGAETEYLAALAIYDAEYKKSASANSYNSMVSGLVKIEAKYHEEHALAETQLKLAHVLLLEKKYDEAIAQTKAALNSDHNSFVALYFQAEILEAKGDQESADKVRQTAKLAIQDLLSKESFKQGQKPDLDPQLLFLTDSLWNTEPEFPALPLEVFRILKPRLNTLTPSENSMLALAYFATKQPAEAEQAWLKGISSDRKLDNAVSRANLGRWLIKAGALRAALPHVQRAYALDPQNVTYRADYEMTKRAVGD